ncbi:hypothetical protein O3M35_005830 [Rhynocoris fuscipes]|uniref:Mitochondrial ribonuclease P catalytic subunit n=1 Tax=Rhynocoris fuscipes TaxID=488301 RepID=A0AAW1DQ11_9HEMI
MCSHLNRISAIFKLGLYVLSNSSKLLARRKYDRRVASIVSLSKYSCSSYALAESDKLNKTDSLVKSYFINRDQQALILNFIKRDLAASSEHIELFRNNVINAGKSVNEYNIDGIVLSFCVALRSFPIGRQYFMHIYQSKNKHNIASVGKFFLLCYHCKEFCSEEDKKLIIELYEELIEKYNTLDSCTCEYSALALSLTSAWRQALTLIDMCKLSSEPTSKMYNALIVASFNNNDCKLGWQLMENAIQENRTISAEAITLSINHQSKLNTHTLLKLFEKYNVRISRDSADVLLENHRNTSASQSIAPNITKINKMGGCSNCNETLKPVELTNSEFLELKKKFLSPVLVGENIFLKSKPAELEAFLKFIEQTGRVDVVLDGLNVAYMAGTNKGKYNTSSMLLKVVDWFSEMGKRVLVIGRTHMLKWPQKHMALIKKKSCLFLTDDVSADDPYVLYAAMFSGFGTIFVSRDQMRAHKFLLKEPTLRVIFSKWQQKHQYYIKTVTANGRVIFERPPPYLQCVQESATGRWHLPLVCESALKSGVPAHVLPQITSWLCLP